jgi:large subunit ribosomal protein LP0
MPYGRVLDTNISRNVYFDKLKGLIEEYKSIFIVTVDNVSSQQMHEIRQALRGEGVVLMGKNTMVRRAIKGFLQDGSMTDIERILPYVKGEHIFIIKELWDAAH